MPNGLELPENEFYNLPASADRSLLERVFTLGDPPDSRRVFVNRTLRMEKIQHLGFDLDWTLAPYYRLPLEELIFRLSLTHLVEQKGFPVEILRSEFRPDFPHRGLIVDRRNGNIFKMNRHRYVGLAYNGRKKLDRRERIELYRTDPIDISSDDFYRVDTLFELSEINLFSELIEMRKKRPEWFPDTTDELFQIVRTTVDTVHADGSLKSKVSSDLPRFLPREEDLALSLQRFRFGGKKLFLLTNSGWEYTNKLCSYLLDGILPGVDHWLDYFSLVIVNARKPGFFRRREHFTVLDQSGKSLGECSVPEWGKIYSGGNREGLMELFQSPGEQVLYLGDHIYGDILATKLKTTWRTALIVRELEEEIQHGLSKPRNNTLYAFKTELAKLGREMDDLRDTLDLAEALRGQDGALPDQFIEDLSELLEEKRIEHRALRHRVRRLQGEISMPLNPTWGSVFKLGGNKSLFGDQCEDFACVYASRVSNFLYYGSNHYFRVLQDPLPHEQV